MQPIRCAQCLYLEINVHDLSMSTGPMELEIKKLFPMRCHERGCFTDYTEVGLLSLQRKLQ